MKKPEEIITDSEIESVWGNADYGSTPKRKVIADTLLKTACGYSTGKFSVQIGMELGLITQFRPGKFKLTELGREYLFSVFNQFNF